MMTFDLASAWLQLILTETLSFGQRLQLLRSGSIHQAVQRLALTSNDQRRIEATYSWLEQPNHDLICLDDPRYPSLLLEIDSPPLALFVVGDAKQLALTGVAIVGSRHSTALGEATANDFAAELNARGICVISGMARGIDAAAHEGALTNRGNHEASTIAVLGSGINLCYPASNRQLYSQLAQRGCLVSEYPLDYPPRKENFPRRNRIVAGLSRGVLIVEAARNSGSLITAKQALGYGREVFAIPGSIHSATSKGCHQLIREGATLCESVEDIISALSWNQPRLFAKDDGASSQLAVDNRLAWDWFGTGPVGIDELCARSGQSVQIWLQQLGNWEMNGLIERTLDGRFQRAVI
jgi:DNA processing protein